MKDKKRNRRTKRITIIISMELWEKLKIESIKRNKTLGELIEEKIKELERIKSNMPLPSDEIL